MAPKRYDDSGLLADLRPLLGAVPSGDALLREVEAAGAPPGLVVALGGVLRELCASKGGAAPAAEVPSLDGAAAVLPSVSFSSPRGRFDAAFFEDTLVLKGPKSSLVVPYSAMQRVVILDSLPKDKKQTVLMMFCLSSESEIIYGKQRLTTMLLKTLESKEVSVTDPADPSGAPLAGAEAVVLCQLLGKLGVCNSEDFFASPSEAVFRTLDGVMAIKANVKVTDGFLFPLADALCFVEKPALLLPHQDILSVEFLRAAGGSATFDITVHCKDDSIHEFGQIDRSHLSVLEGYVQDRRIRIGAPESSGEEGSGDDGGGEEGEDEDSSDDEDFDPEAGDDSEGPGSSGSDSGDEGSGSDGDFSVESGEGISASQIKSCMQRDHTAAAAKKQRTE
eukprot:jgi/Tetstr1/428485/TSEL_018496.t1